MDVDETIDFHKLNQEFFCISINSQITAFPKNSTSISISFDTKGMYLRLPRYKQSSKTILVLLSESDVERVLLYSDELSFCFISIITSSNFGEYLKENLKTYKEISPYFNPDAETTKQLKISFLLQNVTDDISVFLCSIYGEKVIRIKQESALQMLKSAPPTNNSNAPSLSVSATLVYPQIGGIEVKRKDIATLENAKYLNDIIIDFYLKYIYFEKIPKDVQERTHIFISYFYKSLELNLCNENKNKTEQKVIENLSQWTKNVDIFSKDFIFVPIHQKKHWFLVVICYLSEIFKTTEEIALDCFIHETEKNGPSEPLPDLTDDTQKRRKRAEPIKCVKKEPCICVFDSLDSGARISRRKLTVANTLKEFFVKLYKSKHPEAPCNWSRLLFLKALCPQQKNTYDCGIYLLQYVESFFEKPITYFGDPLPDLKNWFTNDVIKHKRTEIKNVISELKEKYTGSPMSPERYDVIDLINK